MLIARSSADFIATPGFLAPSWQASVRPPHPACRFVWIRKYPGSYSTRRTSQIWLWIQFRYCGFASALSSLLGRRDRIGPDRLSG